MAMPVNEKIVVSAQKTLIKIFGIIIILSMVFGCSTVRTLDPNYEAYKQAIL